MSVDNTRAARVADYNGRRKILMLSNQHATDRVTLGDQSITDRLGAELGPGASVILDGVQGECWAISAAGAVVIGVTEWEA